MPEELSITDAACSYCGHALDGRVYFCPSCAKPHRAMEIGLPSAPPPFENIETRLRTKAPEVWTVLFTFLSVMMVTGWMGLVIWGKDDWGAAVVMMSIALLVTTTVFLFRYWSDVRPLLTATGISKPASWIGMAALVPMLALNYGYHSFLINLVGAEIEDYNNLFTSSLGPLIFICVMPAVVEEIAFRGIIQHRLETAVEPWIAIAASSVVFSAAHFSPLSAPYLALLGGLLGWMKWKTGSLYPPMLAHFAHNYIVVGFFDI